MLLEVNTSKLNALTKTDKLATSKEITNKSISIFDKINEHKTETIIGGIATASLISLSILARKKIPKSLNAELLKNWTTSTEPLTKREVKLAKKELENFIEGLQLKTIRKKVKVKFLHTSGSCGGSIDIIDNSVYVDNSVLTIAKMCKITDEKGRIKFWEICGEGTNTHYPMICNLDDLPQEIQKDTKLLTKLERLNFAKSLAAHEAFHLSQICRMLRHPNIGKEKVIEFINPTIITKSRIQKVVNNKNIFKKLLLRIFPNFPDITAKIDIISTKYYWKDIVKEEKLKPESDIAKQTMNEYLTHKQFICSTPTDENKYFQAYINNPLERGAYEFQAKVTKENNLL